MNYIPARAIVVTDNSTGVDFSVEVCCDTIDERGWTDGRIAIPNVGQNGLHIYEFCAKVYDLPSKYGINEGRISKLNVKDVKTNTEVIGYDRGWYIEPHCPQEHAALNALLEIFSVSK